MAKGSRVRVPKLRFLANRGIGWHVSYRDPATGIPRKHRFRIDDRAREGEARAFYHAWVAKHLGVNTDLLHVGRVVIPYA